MEEFFINNEGEVIEEPVEGMVGYDNEDNVYYFINGCWVPCSQVYAIV